MTATDITRSRRSSCVFSSPVHPAGSARPSPPNSSPQVIRSSAWHDRMRPPRRSPPPARRCSAATSPTSTVCARVRNGVDGIIHTAFIHDFTAMANSAAVDFAAVQLFGDLFEGSDRPLVIASGILGAVSVETDRPDPATAMSPRILTEHTLLGFADRGIRSSAVRLPPTVHGDGDHGFMAALIGIDRQKAELRLHRRRQQPLAGGPPPRRGAPVLPRAREGAGGFGAARRSTTRACPCATSPRSSGDTSTFPSSAWRRTTPMDHFGWLGPLLAIDSPASSAITRELLGWAADAPESDRRPRAGALLPDGLT